MVIIIIKQWQLKHLQVKLPLEKGRRKEKELTPKAKAHGTKTAKIMLKDTKVKVGSLLLLAIALCGCTTVHNYDNQDAAYRYYVIDANADVPDANFETFEEASIYKKEFAEYHDYVIVKIDERYKVYNMELMGTIQNEN